ncbi:hypothetical protein [Steroidobacter sp.]|uniref:hypothetical protein n=1 Tax=Steroidobacter sp. TaxID=1978227 RepID=UPI001A53FAC7|nr:hypothetical protein [Steroidobacter sp.]MBL8270653.1 hypothetical protein [Steroidobacter sp.]
MKLYGPDGKEMMTVSAIERDGANLIIKGKIFGAMPMSARLKPAEVRSALKLMNWKTLLFALTLPFRKN